MSSQFVGFRLNYKKDSDILYSLENAKDRTQEIKRLLRLGISISNGEITKPTRKSEPKEIDWRPAFTKPEKVNQKEKPPTNDVVANILGGFE